MLNLLNIKKFYDKTLALEIPSLQLGNNIYWAKGPNGSGKSTLLRMVAGLLPFQGNILLNGASLKRRSLAYRRQVSWGDAEPLFPPFMTGTELIRFYQGIRGNTYMDTNNLIELFGTKEFIDQKLSTYSSGMTKKLSLILAFLGNTPLIVLDEPLITLDTAARNDVCSLIMERHRNGTSFLLSSHMEPDTGMLQSVCELRVHDHTVSLT